VNHINVRSVTARTSLLVIKLKIEFKIMLAIIQMFAYCTGFDEHFSTNKMFINGIIFFKKILK